MSNGITEHVAYERGHEKGYTSGFEEGRKRAFELIGELADFYEHGCGIAEDASDEEKLLDKNSRTSQVNACRYAQIVIRQNDFTDADLPW
jgi:flagellar biosynthesis/type III secretory pathway protein FliH